MKITVNKVRRPKNKTEEREAGKLLNDKEQSDWETGKLGRDVKHMKPTNITLSGKPTSLRLSEELKEKITRLARKKGLSTHSYIRMVLLEHVSQVSKRT